MRCSLPSVPWAATVNHVAGEPPFVSAAGLRVMFSVHPFTSDGDKMDSWQRCGIALGFHLLLKGLDKVGFELIPLGADAFALT